MRWSIANAERRQTPLRALVNRVYVKAIDILAKSGWQDVQFTDWPSWSVKLTASSVMRPEENRHRSTRARVARME